MNFLRSQNIGGRVQARLRDLVLPLGECRAKQIGAGFTLIETLVAITILITAIMVPLTIAARGLQNAHFAKEQLTAVFLAQEGVEAMRLARDSYSIAHQGSASDDWYGETNSKFSQCASPSGNGCGVDMRTVGDSSQWRPCGGATSENCRLKYDPDIDADRGMYTYETGELSPYKRVVKLDDVGGSNNEVLVEVTVSWTSNVFLTGGERKVVLQSRLFNQYDDY